MDDPFGRKLGHPGTGTLPGLFSFLGERRLRGGRWLRLPHEVRTNFSDGVVLNRGFDGCVELRSPAAFDAFSDLVLSKQETSEAEQRKLRRYIAGTAFDSDINGEGDIELLAPLLEHGAFQDEVVIAAEADVVKLWPRQRKWQIEDLLDADTTMTGVDEDPGRKYGRALRLSLAAVNAQVIAAIAQDPRAWHQMHHRDFEVILADLFAREGFDVLLTAASRDGGADLVVVRHEVFGRVVTAVEAKHYRPDRSVGVGVVRSLLGTINTHRFNAGLVVTTSTFTRDAQALVSQYAPTLSLMDYFGLQQLVNRPPLDWPYPTMGVGRHHST